MALKNLNVVIGADTKGFQKGLKTVQGGITQMKSGLSSLAKSALSLAGVAVGLKAIADSLQAYVGLESSISRVNGLFGEASKYITYFAENTAKSFGMSESSAYQYAAIYGNLFRGITTSAEENAKVTIAMLKASAVVASKTGRTMEDVMERIRSGLLGNTEAIEDLGINVNVAMLETTDAFKRIADGRSWEQLTFYEQQQIRTLAILEQAHNNFGDEVQQGSAYSLSVLSGAFKDLQATAGAFINRALAPIVGWLTQIVRWATAGLKALAALLGINIKGDLSAAASSMAGGAAGAKDMAGGLDKAGKAAKKAKKEIQGLAGFDEVNTLGNDANKDESEGAGGDSGAGAGAGAGASVFDGLPGLEYEEMPEPDTGWIDDLISKYNNLFNVFKNSSIVKDITFIFDEIKRILTNVWAEVKPEFDKGFGNLFSGLRALGSVLWNDVIVGLGGDLIKVLAGWFEENSPTIQADLITNFKNIFDGVFSAGNVFSDIGTIISDALAEAKPAVLNAFHDLVSAAYSVFDTSTFIITDTFAYIWRFIESWISENKENLVKALSDAWTNSANTVSLFSSIIEDTFNSLKEFWTRWGHDILDIILSPLRTLGNMVLDTWNNFVMPIWEKITDWLKKIWDESLKELVDQILGFVGRVAEVFGMIWSVIGPVLETAWANITNFFRVGFKLILDIVMPIIQYIIDVIKSIMEVLNGVLDFIIGIFTGDWKRAWEGIKEVFEGIWDGIKATFKFVFNIALGVVEGFINSAIGVINSFIRSINLVIKAINAIPGVNINPLGALLLYLPARASTFATLQTISFVFDEPHNSVGLTITFDNAANEYAADFDVKVYAGATLILSESVTGNKAVQYIVNTPIADYTKVELIIKKWAKGYRRASNDNSSWTVITTIHRSYHSDNSWTDIIINSPAPYTYYKIEYTSSDQPRLYIYEWEFYEGWYYSNATAIWQPKASEGILKQAIIEADQTLNTGTITYYISRDNGTTFTQCALDTLANISGQPPGTNIVLKAVITGDAQINGVAWGGLIGG